MRQEVNVLATDLKIREKKRGGIVLKLVLLVIICAAVAAFGMAAKEELPYVIAEYKNSQVQDSFTDFGIEDEKDAGTVKETTEKNLENSKKLKKTNVPQDWNGIDWEGLKKLNEDIVGWIRIPDTAINYAILKGTRNDYYLNHNMDGSYNILGSIFLPSGAPKDMSEAHTILYGHNMASGQMFGQLSNYEDVNFWKTHPYVYIYTPDQTHQMAVYSAYQTKDNSDTYTTGYTLGSKEFKNWIRYTQEQSLYATEFEPDSKKQIFTLSTCADYGVVNDRFVIHCVNIKTKNKFS